MRRKKAPMKRYIEPMSREVPEGWERILDVEGSYP